MKMHDSRRLTWDSSVFIAPAPEVVSLLGAAAAGSGSGVFLALRRLLGGMVVGVSLAELSEEGCCLGLSSSSVKLSSTVRSLASSSSMPSSAEPAFSDSLSEPAALALDPSSSLPLPVPSDPGQRKNNVRKSYSFDMHTQTEKCIRL